MDHARCLGDLLPSVGLQKGVRMNNEWIIDVLVDLRQYALKNYYIGLAEQLDDAIVMAAAEVRVMQPMEDVDDLARENSRTSESAAAS